MLFDFSADSVSRSYSAGDVVEGEFEFILPPKSIDVYWGADAELINRLTTQEPNAWQGVYDEVRYNLKLSVTAHTGAVVRNYPVDVQGATDGSAVLADVTLSGGGIGHVPMVVRGVEPGQALVAQRYSGGGWVDLESVNIAQHSYYQGYFNADGTIDYVFNIRRPSLDLNEDWRIRVLAQMP